MTGDDISSPLLYYIKPLKGCEFSSRSTVILIEDYVSHFYYFKSNSLGFSRHTAKLILNNL